MSSDFLPFAAASTANVISQAQFAALLDRSRGFQIGLARSEEFNKVWRQTSTMVAAIAQFIDERVPGNVIDDGNVGNLANQFAMAVRAVAATISGGIAEAPVNGQWFLRRNQAWVDSTNLNLDGGVW